ncbi:MAG: PLP-dependent transferase [Acidimicrobiales bacterium]
MLPSILPAAKPPLANACRRPRAGAPCHLAWRSGDAGYTPGVHHHAALDPDEQAEALIGPGTIRVSCGLEETADIIADFAQALS